MCIQLTFIFGYINITWVCLGVIGSYTVHVFIIQPANSDVLILCDTSQSWWRLGTIMRLWEWMSWDWVSIVAVIRRQARKMLWIIICQFQGFSIIICGVWSCRGAERTALRRGYSWLERVCTWKSLCSESTSHCIFIHVMARPTPMQLSMLILKHWGWKLFFCVCMCVCVCVCVCW